MRKTWAVALLTMLTALCLPSLSGATTSPPTNRLFPFGVSDFTTPISVAKAFGLDIGFPPKAPYFASSSGKESGPDWIEVVTNGPTFVSYIETHESGGHWYVVKMTSPIIQVLTPSDGARVGTWIEVRALAFSAVKYFASSQIDGNLLFSGAFLKKSRSPYTGRPTSIGPDDEVGLYTGRFRSDLAGNHRGWYMVSASNPNGDGTLAAVIIHVRH